MAQAVKNAWAGEIILEDSQGNGEVERAVQALRGQSWTLKQSLEFATRETVDPRSPCLAWLIEHAGHKRAPYDGFAAYERSKGKSLKEISLHFLGHEFQRRADYKLERRWQPGVFMGLRSSPDEIDTEKSTDVF